MLPNSKEETMKFTKSEIEKLTMPGGKTDHIEWDDTTPGFGVRVRASGEKYYIAQYRLGKKQGRETIGHVGKFDQVDDARKLAKKVFDLAASGVNPAAVRGEVERKASQGIVPLMDRFLAARKNGWSEKYHEDNERYLKILFKKLHAKALTEVARVDVSEALAAIQAENGDTTRNRARSALSAFYNWAIGEGLCEHNPVERTNKAPENERDRELSKAELRKLWHALDADVFCQDERDVVRLMILTLQRAAQIGDLTKTEINFPDKRLQYQRQRVKNKKGGKHIIPLASVAHRIISSRDLKDRDFVFGKWDSGFANYTHLKEKIDGIVKFNEPWIFHDLRRTGKTAMSEDLEVAGEVSEAILNHGKKDMDKVYNNAQYLKQKLAALTKWEGYVMEVVREGKLAAA